VDSQVLMMAPLDSPTDKQQYGHPRHWSLGHSFLAPRHERCLVHHWPAVHDVSSALDMTNPPNSCHGGAY
jgi:hypothetical protein